MPIKFQPIYTMTSKIVKGLMRIEAVKGKALYLPLTPMVLHSLRESARLHTTHYSTMIEGNRLEPDEIVTILKYQGHFPGKERDEREIKGYYAALAQVETWAKEGISITGRIIQVLHAIVMSGGKVRVKPTVYRTGQNVIRDSQTKKIIYMPPEAKDVKPLMSAMLTWANEVRDIPCPIKAGILHLQFATIHPYYDGNGRTARLLTTLMLHLGGYDLKGLYSLEEYYARNLEAYYEAIHIGISHNYYQGRAKVDITAWIEYFLEGMANAFEDVIKYMIEANQRGTSDQSTLLKKLDLRQRKAILLFKEYETITSRQVSELFGFKQRTGSALCASWVKNGFLEVVDASNKGRKYKLANIYENLMEEFDRYL